MAFRRFAIYYLPPEAEVWTQMATAWLGWDAVRGASVARPDWGRLPAPITELTAAPRKYGLHATLKPPFFLKPGLVQADLEVACDAMCRGIEPVTLTGLSIEKLGRFLALRPVGDETALKTLAAACVSEPDAFRAPPSEAELARRRAARLTAAQDATLLRWGYPFVMDHFRFHITLTGRLEPAVADAVRAVLSEHLGPLLPRPFAISDIALAGEDAEGRFHLIQRYTLSGSSASSTA